MSDVEATSGTLEGSQPTAGEPFSTGQTILLGFTGSLGSGCSFFAKGIKECLGADGHVYRLSEYIRESLREKGVEAPTTAQMQDEGNRLRRDHGLEHLIARCVEDISEKEQAGALNQNSVILIDGIRNTGEVRTLRAGPSFYLIAVHASKDLRESRVVVDERRFASKEEFATADVRDLEEEGIPYGQQVQLCSDLADIIVSNGERLQEGTARCTRFFNDFLNKYLTVMKALRDGVAVPDRAPSMDETLMTMAFCASLRSSCQKRKVGAVVAHVKTFPELTELVKREEDDQRYQVISSGYNEVPLGTSPCRLSEDERCYRDTLKEKITASFKHCPRCGKEIPEEHRTDYESLSEYQCDCGSTLEACLPGTGGEAGRLLDMCKALHAEESAILGLSGISKNAHGKLVLYTTTFPCNLCANKIVEVGIKTVVYAEPYPMKEAKEILSLGGVETKKFQGVKSSAYFRIYAL